MGLEVAVRKKINQKQKDKRYMFFHFFSHMQKLGIKTKQNDLKTGQGFFGKELCVSRREDGSVGGSVGMTKA